MNNNDIEEVDAVVLGAGFSGLYMLYKLRESGYSTQVYEVGDGVGGVWYWNRYPGAQCDTESSHYCYTFSEELYNEWTWSSRYPKQEELLAYLNYVADKFELWPDIQLNTRVNEAHYDEETKRWIVKTDKNKFLSAKYFITGVGNLSTSNVPNFKGIDSFKGESYHTGSWPKEKVDLKNKRVGVIGVGSTGVQTIPVVAEEAAELKVFQRTPQYSIPAGNHSFSKDSMEKRTEDFHEIKQKLADSESGFIVEKTRPSAINDTPENRLQVYEEAWKKGGVALQFSYADLRIDPESNKTAADFVRSKIKQTVNDPETAEKLLPSYYFGTKRPVKDEYYYETYNKDNVKLIDIKKHPIEEITPNGIRTGKEEHDLDVIIYATGYDAIIGALSKIDIRGKNHQTLEDKWGNGEGVETYLGLANAGFPNMFMITGPESPSVLTNMVMSIQQHVEWIIDALNYVEENNIETIEATKKAEINWSNHCAEVANKTLYVETDSWYTGSNIKGKTNRFMIYLGGLKNYTSICDNVAENGYEGFKMIQVENAIK